MKLIKEELKAYECIYYDLKLMGTGCNSLYRLQSYGCLSCNGYNINCVYYTPRFVLQDSKPKTLEKELN